VQARTFQTLAVLGGQWGDEGKGKVVDLLSDRFDVVARYHGGHNAGHTVRFGKRHFALHLLPAGVLRGKPAWIGDGVVLDPDALFREIDELVEGGIEVESLLKVSDRAHLILPYHRLLDAAREAAAGDSKIGTTLRGIGPAYETRAARTGIRAGDLRHPETLGPKIERIAREIGALARALGVGRVPSARSVAASLRRTGERLRPLLADTGQLARAHLRAGGTLLAEGAHGAMLDLAAGTYPYVTSSNCTSAGVAAGLRIAPQDLSASLVVVKAYATRVGEGPFPTEMNNDIGEFLRLRGNEFGTSTGRPRRTGWFDGVAARTAVEMSGARFLALTKLDVLDSFSEIPVCVGYRLRGEPIVDLPAEVEDFEQLRPLYVPCRGWEQDTTQITEFSQLPSAAREYVRFLEQLCGAKVVILSTGPKRTETIRRGGGDFWSRLP
jgi:adenylosuccinate synthase